MKWLFALLLVCGLAATALYLPCDRKMAHAAARLTARGLRAGWDWVASLGQEQQPAPPARPPKRMAQAAAPGRRVSREGIVPQPPKEKLDHRDRAALDELVARPR